MKDKSLALWKDIERLVESQRVDRERVAMGGYGARTSLLSLRRTAHDIKLRCEHFRAITGKTGDLLAADLVHEVRWQKRRSKVSP
jgi:hypothetical protein